MGSTLEVHVTVKRDGKLLSGFPFARRIQCDEAQEFSVEQATGGGYITLPTTSLDVIQALLLTPSVAVTVRLHGQSDAGLVLNPGGLLLILDSTISAGASINAIVNNASGSTAVLDGIAGGT